MNAFEGLGDPLLLILLDSELTCLWAWATVGMESQIPWTLLEAVGRRRGLWGWVGGHEEEEGTKAGTQREWGEVVIAICRLSESTQADHSGALYLPAL